MKFGLFHTVQWPEGSEQRDRMRESLTQAVHAEEIGFHSVWFTEHHFTRHGITADNLGILANLACATERVRLGSAVSVLPFHHPLRLAESAATVDLLSDGRLDFGIGRGYQWTEYHGFDLDLADGADLFSESIDLITRAWTSEEPFNHQGANWQFEDVNVLPRPLQKPYPPIWSATASEAGLRRCAENGWNVMLPQGLALAAVGELVDTYKRALADVGQSYDPSKLVVARALYVAKDDDTAHDEADDVYHAFRANVARLTAPPGGSAQNRNPFDTKVLRETALFGSPATCARMLLRLQEMGVEYVILFVHLGGLKHSQIMQSMDMFAQEVQPRLAEAAPTSS